MREDKEVWELRAQAQVRCVRKAGMYSVQVDIRTVTEQKIQKEKVKDLSREQKEEQKIVRTTE